MKVSIFALLLSVSFICSCAVGVNKDSRPENSSAEKAADPASGKTIEAQKTEGKTSSKSDKNLFEENAEKRTDCENINTGDKKILKSQTFPVDFAPFKNSCFVTAHDPEYTDPPLGSEFSIYRNGEEVFFFPSQFNGVTIGCWVEAVAFQDLNADNLTDIIVVGKCSAKTAPYNENMVYVNTGSSFITDEGANYKLADFQKVKDIADFVKRNKQLFF